MKVTDFKQINKKFTRYVIPAIVGMLVQSLYTILDGIIVGRGIGEVALGAVNVVYPFTMLVTALAMLIGVGGALLGFTFRGHLSIFLGANEELFPYAIAYLKWSAAFSFIQMVSFGKLIFSLMGSNHFFILPPNGKTSNKSHPHKNLVETHFQSIS